MVYWVYFYRKVHKGCVNVIFFCFISGKKGNHKGHEDFTEDTKVLGELVFFIEVKGGFNFITH